MPSPEPQRVAGPFSGLLVVDLTHVLNGPFGTTILNDLGARVIKIEPPATVTTRARLGPSTRDNRCTSALSTAARRALSSTSTRKPIAVSCSTWSVRPTF
jgi:crotonobetainyl-CoA:carnitine CoA-transferase CaiB-like acyl-CoA transferase